MESKRKKLRVPRARLETHDPSESPIPPVEYERLVRRNARLVRELLRSKVWFDILDPLISEGVASVSGRRTNGRYYHGELTKGSKERDYLAGYQRALMDLFNRIMDFPDAEEKMLEKKKEDEKAKSAPLYNPFMEDFDA